MDFNVGPGPVPRLPYLNRSYFGEQPKSSHVSEPFHEFTRGSRAVHSKLHISNELTESQTISISPGPIYRQPCTLDPGVAEKFAVAPAY